MRVTIGLGSNLGDRLGHLQAAVDALAALSVGGPPLVSPVFETDPVGGPEQPDYLNAVVQLQLPDDTALWPLADAIERARERVRNQAWGPRTLDVDILAVDGVVSADPTLTLPHPRVHTRAFVLIPWLAIDTDATVPGHGSVASLVAGLAATERTGVRARRDLELRPT